MSQKSSVKKLLGAFLVVTFLTGGLTLAAAGKVHAATEGSSQLSAPLVININKAGAEELDQIRGIGPIMADRIIAPTTPWLRFSCQFPMGFAGRRTVAGSPCLSDMNLTAASAIFFSRPYGDIGRSGAVSGMGTTSELP